MNNPFKILLYSCLLLILSDSFAQENYTIGTFPNRYRTSWEIVQMPYEPNLGFIGIGLDLFNLVNSSSNFYVGLHSYSAMTGLRPGLITLGVGLGYQKQVLFKDFYLDIGGFVGGGGGGGAPDGGGLIIRPHFNLEKQFGNIGLSVGLSHIEFPTGAIGSTQINTGITINSFNYFAVSDKPSNYLSDQLFNTNKLRVAIVGTQYYNFKKGSTYHQPHIEKGRVGLLGAQIERYINPHFYGMIKLNGAIIGGADGYMNILLGAGGKLPVLKDYFSLETRLLGGPSGGGAIESGGGATVQAEIGTSIKLYKNYDLKLMVGKTLSPGKRFEANHMEISLGRSFERLFPKRTKEFPEEFAVQKKDYHKNKMAFLTYNRTYFPPNLQTKNPSRYYQPYFNLLGFEFQKFIGERITLNGGTVWAYQGDYGAYAEGLLGLTYYQPLSPTWNINFKAMAGAGGGGGINLGSGLLSQFLIGTEKSLNSKWSLCLHAGKLVPLKGNFTPYIFDIGIKFNINQMLKK